MKKKTFAKITALTVALVMLLAFVAACGGNDDPPPLTTGPGPATTPEPTPTPVDDDDDDDDDSMHAPAYDFGGREFVIYTWMPGVATFDPDPGIEDPDSDDIDAWDNLQRILEDFNGSVSYEIAAHEDIFALFVASMVAGSPPGDMVHIPRENLTAAVAGDFLQAMEDVVPASDPFWNPFPEWWTHPTGNVGNRHFGMADTNNPSPWTMSYNKNLMNAAGLEDPGLLYDRGDWTWDVFLTYLRTLTTLGPDGVPNQWGLSGPLEQVLRLMLASNDGSMINTDDFSIGLDSPNSLRAFEFFDQVIVQEQLNRPLPADLEWNSTFTSHVEGTVGFWVNEHWHIWVDGGFHFDPDIHIGGVPFPRGPNNNRGYTHFVNINTGLSIPAGVHEPLQCYNIWFEMATRWRFMSIEALESETGEATLDQWWRATNSYILDTIYGDTEADGDRMLNDWRHNGKFDWGSIMSIMGHDDVMRLASGEVTTAQFIEEVRPEMNDQLDLMFGIVR